jgi:hypothetical protein
MGICCYKKKDKIYEEQEEKISKCKNTKQEKIKGKPE